MFDVNFLSGEWINYPFCNFVQLFSFFLNILHISFQTTFICKMFVMNFVMLKYVNTPFYDLR